MTSSPDVTVVIPAHHEGRLANHTMTSVWRSVEYAASKGVSAEVLVVMDRPNLETARFFRVTLSPPSDGKKWISATWD